MEYEYWVIVPFSRKESAEMCLKGTHMIGTIIRKKEGTYDKKY